MREMSVGAGFWHETYHARGGVDVVYVAMDRLVGLQHFAPERQPVGPSLSARSRIQGGARYVTTEDVPKQAE
ncbi:hypothetical protein AIN02nite_27410 [Acetobacter indonesiensis]|uniref:Cupin n=1 Tax=Acetobacter indonesiensis TaxID=104101 RepID=A0A6N3T5Z8_9PROT|nr:hypothetical protein AIN02nite_27410 [Acetobacter indonesiensis]